MDNKRNAHFFMLNEKTGKFHAISDIDEIELLIDDETEGQEVENDMFSDEGIDIELSGEIEEFKALLEVSEEPKREKPNPVYVPKHIARRRKW